MKLTFNDQVKIIFGYNHGYHCILYHDSLPLAQLIDYSIIKPKLAVEFTYYFLSTMLDPTSLELFVKDIRNSQHFNDEIIQRSKKISSTWISSFYTEAFRDLYLYRKV